tara:strand:- start:3158 stop:4318 length:1161 start_codon:yes stop_codon:yes gene_type:complete
MKKQKICIIGGGLTGLVTAISLSGLNCEIDLIIGSGNQNIESNGTTAISQENLDFIQELNISASLKKNIWPCEVMKLYTEAKNEKFSKIFEINKTNKSRKIFYMTENSKMHKLMISKIKKIKSISIIRNKNISKIENSGLLKSVKINKKNYKYNLVIICTGSNSDLAKNIISNQTIEKSYNELSVTVILKHAPLKNDIARQIFFDSETLALLPISNSRTSIVWSIKKNMKENNSFYKKKIKSYAKNYLKNISFASNIKYRNLNFLVRKKYYNNRVLLFGDALHVIHPFVGQGFNMTLRDLRCLKNILEEKINLGLDIGNSDILSEFSNKIKSSNFAFSVSIDLLKNSFSIKNKYFKEARNNILKTLNKNDFAKNIFYEIADKGLKI